ncbi:MAG: hypothetical protein ABIF19_01535 [Planctomycetota bacterium]
MRTISCLLRFSLLVAVTLSSGVTRAYYFARIVETAPVSGTARYLMLCDESNTPAVLTPRTSPAKQLGLYPKRVSVAHGPGHVGTVETALAPSVAGAGALPLVSAAQITPHTLFSLRCLLTV